MIAIVAGSRDYVDASDIYDHLDWVHDEYGIMQVVSGGAKGVDSIAEEWAELEGIPCKVMLADWEQHNKAAGHIRNREMAEWVLKECARTKDTSGLIAFLRNESRGTKGMITVAQAKGFDFIMTLKITA